MLETRAPTIAIIIIVPLLSCCHASSDKEDATHVRIELLSNALHKFKNDTGRFPSNEEGLDSLINCPILLANCKAPYLPSQYHIYDYWGTKIRYQSTSINPRTGKKLEGFILHSYGKNKANNNGCFDDIIREE